MIVAALLDPGSLAAALALAYLGLGAALAWDLGRHGHGLGVRVSALACWPLLLGLRGQRARPGRRASFVARPSGDRGPHADRIDACLRALAASLDEAVDPSASVLGPEQLARLGEALDRADRRLARIDALHDETAAERGRLAGPTVDELLATLAAAREHGQRELDGILAALLQLRVQLGLARLADEGERVRERVAELETRVAALTDLTLVELDLSAARRSAEGLEINPARVRVSAREPLQS